MRTPYPSVCGMAAVLPTLDPSAAVTPLRIGLVGCGRLAELGYLPAIARTPAVVLAAVADPDRERRELLAGHAGAYAGAAELAAAGGVDALVVASPPGAHLADARAGVAAGLRVLVEKPPAESQAAAARLAGLGPAVRVGFNRRFEPGMGELRARLAGAVPVRLDLTLHYRRASWRPRVVADDALLDLGPHVADLAAWLTRGVVRAARAERLTAERAVFAMALDDGYAHADLATHRPHREAFVARDPGGRVLGAVRRGGPAGLLRRGEHGLVASLAAQLDAFASGAGALSPAAEAVAVMEVLDAVRASAEDRGRWKEL